MDRKNKIWGCVYGGVIGFLDECKWAFFNEYFEDVLGVRTAHGYSARWRDEEAWEECENVLYDLCQKNK